MTLNSTLAWTTEAGSWSLDFSTPKIMSIMNLTLDSFSDGGRFVNSAEAVEAALAEEADGAHLFDLGAESTRPGAARVTAEEEWSRLEQVIIELSRRSRLPVSVDTYRAGVAEKSLRAGAAMINDIYAGRHDPRMFEVVAEYQVPIVLMHMQGEPATMQENPHYEDVVSEVHDFLLERAEAAEAAGILRERIILDPGIGFGKTGRHNLTLLKHFRRAMPQGYHHLMALSRKAFLGHILGGVPPAERENITTYANTVALSQGASIIRVHRAALHREMTLLMGALAQV